MAGGGNVETEVVETGGDGTVETEVVETGGGARGWLAWSRKRMRSESAACIVDGDSMGVWEIGWDSAAPTTPVKRNQ